jgi:hypothetical protein
MESSTGRSAKANNTAARQLRSWSATQAHAASANEALKLAYLRVDGPLKLKETQAEF